MNSPDFEKCKSRATELLYNQNLKDRILNIQKLDYGEKTIIFDTIQNYALLTHSPLKLFLSEKNDILKDGCTLVLGDNSYLVLYNADTTYWEHLNWTLAHEIGHIYLDHTEDGPIEEIEAHFFAAQLFMPEYSIRMIQREHGIVKASDLIEIFGVSQEAAERRINTMRRLHSYKVSAIDRSIWEIQKERVDLYYRCNQDRSEYRYSLDYELYMEAELEHHFFMEAYI